MIERTWRTVFFIVLVAICLTACSLDRDRRGGKVIHEYDSSVWVDEDDGARVKILSFKWRYHKATDQIKVTGWLQNQSDQPIEAGRLMANAFDQYDKPLGFFETFLHSSYLKPEEKSQFELTYHNGKWVTAVVLKYWVETRN